MVLQRKQACLDFGGETCWCMCSKHCCELQCFQGHVPNKTKILEFCVSWLYRRVTEFREELEFSNETECSDARLQPEL